MLIQSRFSRNLWSVAIVLVALSVFIYYLYLLFDEKTKSIQSKVAAVQDCRINGYAFKVICGEIDVPRYHQKHDVQLTATRLIPDNNSNVAQDTLKLKWYKIPSRARYPQQNPVIWIPDLGVDATERAPAMAQALTRLLNTRDLIWLEIRGTGTASILDCRLDIPTDVTTALDHFSNKQHLTSCQKKVIQQGGLNAFNPTQIARDFELLRVHLGISSLNVFTEGQGAAVADIWADISPDSLRTIVMDSPPTLVDMRDKNRYQGLNKLQQQSLQVAKVFDALILSCTKNQVCNTTYPNFGKHLDILFAQLPKKIQVKNPYTQTLEQLYITPELFAEIIKTAIQQPEQSVNLPALLNLAVKADWQPLIALDSQRWLVKDSKFSEGLYLLSQCHDYEHLATADQPADDSFLPSQLRTNATLTNNYHWFYKTSLNRLKRLCLPLTEHKKPINEELNKSKQLLLTKKIILDQQDKLVKVPTLLLTGELDPLAGNEWSKYKNATLIRVAFAGRHILAYTCARDVVFRFINTQNHQTNLIDEIQPQCLFNIPYPSIHPLNQIMRAPQL